MSTQIPKIEESNKFNFFTSIWIVPFIALMIAGWLAYQYFSELGPQIRIVFPENAGLQAGQSHIKYRNVPIGTVQKIELQEDGEGIVVIARMDKTASPYLNNSSKFWIVKPEVGIGGVSGLDTLISGTYINMHAEKEEETQYNFLGQSYAYRDDSKGEYFVLNTPQGSNTVKVGTPIYLKNIKVGQVEYVVLALDNSSVEVIVYIDNSYTPYVRTDSNFWVRSTFAVSLNTGRVDMSIAPVTDLIQGAIEFSSQKKGLVCTVPNGHIFKLYSSKGEVENTFIGSSEKQIEDFKIYSQESIAKLNIGAPVRYEGFEVGKVKGMKIYYEQETHTMQSEIIVSINLSVFANANDTLAATGKKNFKKAIEEGLRAEIIPSDPITGFLYVNFVFLDSDDNQTIAYKNAFNVIPSIHTKSGDIMASMTKILDKINALPLKALVDSLSKVVEDADSLVLDTSSMIKDVDKPLVVVLNDLKTTIKNLNKMTNKKTFATMPDELSKTFRELTKTLKTTKKVVKGYDGNSLIVKQLSQTLNIVTQTSKEMQLFLKMLNRKPNSLIFGDK
jgi:paraquat-inducible protein B